ncbi:MAG: hypothetical protein SPLM_09350 [Spiroplasma phoeniceum]|uniref:hypothetical protein n=1 Tax=Spiroplasma phoeniceum TaxID=47835 RepID=UPI003133F809
MKKLLSLLSVLTISGTAVPTTIAASPYQKEKELNSDNNYKKTNNLEKLNRHKRAIPSLNIPEVKQLGCVMWTSSSWINFKIYGNNLRKCC